MHDGAGHLHPGADAQSGWPQQKQGLGVPPPGHRHVFVLVSTHPPLSGPPRHTPVGEQLYGSGQRNPLWPWEQQRRGPGVPPAQQKPDVPSM